MDDSATSNTKNTDTRIAFGMSDFGEEQRQQFGQDVRIAMACIEGKDEPTNEKAMPFDESAIRQRLKALSQASRRRTCQYRSQVQNLAYRHGAYYKRS